VKREALLCICASVILVRGREHAGVRATRVCSLTESSHNPRCTESLYSLLLCGTARAGRIGGARPRAVEFGAGVQPLSILPENCRTCGARVAVPGSDTHTCHNTLNTSHDITRRAEHTQGHTVRFFHRPRRVDCSRLFAVTRRCGMGDVSEMSPRCPRESEPAAAARVDETRSDASACNWRAGGGEPDFGRARQAQSSLNASADPCQAPCQAPWPAEGRHTRGRGRHA
jgi:hypothetical protein